MFVQLLSDSFVCASAAESQDSPHGDANLQLWDTQSGALIKALFQKKADSWSVSVNRLFGPAVPYRVLCGPVAPHCLRLMSPVGLLLFN